MHRKVAEGSNGGHVLEIGAGNLNHVRYHPQAPVYDAVEPFRELWEDSPARGRIRHMYGDLEQVREDAHYDSIVSVAVLEHLTDLPAILARSGLLLAEGGTFRAGFPSEGGLLWGLAWRLTTGLKYRWERRLDYGAIMRHEHVNTAAEILALLGYFYERIAVNRFPAPGQHVSFYTVAIAGSPRVDRCWNVVTERKRCHAKSEAGPGQHRDPRV
jgi:trans-aconitate methyltransferase